MYKYIPQVKISYVSDYTGIERFRVTSASDAERILRLNFEPERIGHVEIFYMMLLNRNNKILGIQKVSEGGICGTVVDPRIVLQAAILANASSIILCHNHPSGNTTPSQQDIELTKKVRAAAKFMDIAVNDHIILSPEGDYFSFADNGLMM